MKTIFLILALLFSREVVLAQYFEWVKTMGRIGTQYNSGNSVVTDVNGNVYTTGFFSGTIDFDPGVGVYNLSSFANGNNDIFISKLDAFGNFLWAKHVGSIAGQDEGKDIAVDALGNVYITGFFSGTADFDVGTGVYNLTSTGGKDIFILKLDTNGNLVWAIAYSSNFTSSEDIGQGIILDATGNIYTTGSFAGTIDFDPGAGIANLSSNSRQTFVCKLNSNGGYIWAKNMSASNGFSHAYAITLDNMGNVYTTGYFDGTVDFNPGIGVANLVTMGGTYDTFISKLDSSGNFVWIKQLGSSGTEIAYTIAVDTIGNVYTGGTFIGFTDFDPGMNTITLNSSFGRAFVSKIDINGNFVWAKQIGDVVRSLVLDMNANIYTTGDFSGTRDFDPNAGVFNLTTTGTSTFVTKWDSNGDFTWAYQMEGGIGGGVGITVDALENIYTTGSFAGTVDFDPGIGVHNIASLGSGDIFVHKMNALPTPITKIENNLTCTLYPNPTNSILQLEIAQDFRIVNIQIINTLGQVLAQTQTSDRNSQLVLPNEAGIYFIRVEVEGKIGTYKVVKN